MKVSMFSLYLHCSFIFIHHRIPTITTFEMHYGGILSIAALFSLPIPAVYLCVSMVVRVGETFQNVVGRSAHIQNAECLGQFPMQLLKLVIKKIWLNIMADL